MGLCDDILAIDDRPLKEVDVPIWSEKLGRKFLIRAYDGVFRDRLTAMFMQLNGSRKLPEFYHESIVVAGVVDEKGEPVFKLEQVVELSRKNSEPIKFLADQISVLSGNAPGSLEEARKNSSGEPSDASGSDSPTITATP